MGHARALIPIEDESLQIEIRDIIVKKHLSVRQTEELVRKVVKRKENI